MWYAIHTLLRETSRFVPAMVTVGACAMLLMSQISLFLGTLTYVSKPVAWTDADLWITHPEIVSYEQGRPIPERWSTRVASEPGVERLETYLMGPAILHKAEGGTEPCTVVGVSVTDHSLGAGRILSPAIRARLRRPGAVVADESELGRFGFRTPGYAGEISGCSVYYVGAVRGFKRFAAPYVFCSAETARRLLRSVGPNETTFILAHCTNAGLAPSVAERLRARFTGMGIHTRQEFVGATRYYWFTRTKAGLTIAVVAIISSVVSLFVTSQTLHAATVAARREYAVLDAMGIPRNRVAMAVVYQSFWVGLIAAIMGTPASYVVSTILEFVGVPAVWEPWLIAVGGLVTIGTALLSGIVSLRSLRLIEPAELLH